jgi:dipeptidyl-peptidase III
LFVCHQQRFARFQNAMLKKNQLDTFAKIFKMKEFKVLTEQFDDIKILRYQVPGFAQLPLKQKELLYYLQEAALSGRDIIYDQHYRYNLLVRHTLETILKTYSGDRQSPQWEQFRIYVKKVWFSNGIHHHYSTDKFVPQISTDYFRALVKGSDFSEFPFQIRSTDDFADRLLPVIFDPAVDSKRVVQDAGKDMVKESANNFYFNITQREAEDFYNKLVNPEDARPVSYGLNSRLEKQKGQIVENVWKLGGMYSSAIEKIVGWLQNAVHCAESAEQKAALEKLIEFYSTGDLRSFDEYSVLWLKDQASVTDVVNGFIEVYGDPLGRKATYESVVSIKDPDATKRASTISNNANWFEANAPIDQQFKKQEVKGVSASGINVTTLAGDCSPSSPIGINLPNADWIRAEHGSKSVTINNIMSAYEAASRESGAIEEFAWSEDEIELSKKYGDLAMKLHVDLHEIIGHGSGKLAPGVANPSETLKNYASTIEETRADLFALYFAIDPKLVELGLMPSVEVGFAEYNSYIRGGLMTQLVRIEPGKNLEESHMRNRQLIAQWAFERGKDQGIIEMKKRDGKTYFVVNNHDKLREIFGELLREIQRIKSEGDYEAAKNLVENYGVIVHKEIHDEVLVRWKSLNIAPFAGFINPKLVPVYNNRQLSDVIIEYPEDFTEQMLYYSKHYSTLPVEKV